ncbi:MAG TPA: hypothetical protein PLO88_03890, partial [Bacilli bacterium]|nr:hypothetical protein [Bacilli bacterium]
MIKEAIGILDMGMESFPLLFPLSKTFKYERFVYANDLLNQPYEGLEPEAIVGFVKENVERLQKQNLKLLIVGSDVIWEYAQDFLKTLSIPVFNIVDTLIEYINNHYEQKNMVLLAKNSILEANLYQKNFKYNHLYSLPSDELEAIVLNKMTKTTQSFYVAKTSLLPALKKEVDIIITSTPLLRLVKTEIDEYLRGAEITDVLAIWEDKIKSSGLVLYEKGRGRIEVLGNVPKKQWIQQTVGE